jgi:hypothetical protein
LPIASITERGMEIPLCLRRNPRNPKLRFQGKNLPGPAAFLGCNFLKETLRSAIH